MVKHPQLAKVLRIIGRALGLTATIFFLAIALGEAVQSAIFGSLAENNAGLLIFVLPTLVALGACIYSWWRLLPAGALLVIVYIFQGIAPAMYLHFWKQGDYESTVWRDILLSSYLDAFTLPYLIAGILLLVSWWLYRKESSTGMPETTE